MTADRPGASMKILNPYPMLELDDPITHTPPASHAAQSGIIISNSLAIMLSFGLLWPWAQVRRYRYLVESTRLRPSDNIDSIIDTQSQAGHSIGDAASDAGGIELQF